MNGASQSPGVRPVAEIFSAMAFMPDGNFLFGFPISVRKLPAIVELKNIEGHVAEIVERFQEDAFVDPAIKAVPGAPDARRFFKPAFAEFCFE